MLKHFDGRKVTFNDPIREAVYLKFLPNCGRHGKCTRDEWYERVNNFSTQKVMRIYMIHISREIPFVRPPNNA